MDRSSMVATAASFLGLIATVTASEISIELTSPTISLPPAPGLFLFGNWPPGSAALPQLTKLKVVEIDSTCRSISPSSLPSGTTLVVKSRHSCSGAQLAPILSKEIRSPGILLLSEEESGVVNHLPNWGMIGGQDNPDIGGVVVSVGKSWGDQLVQQPDDVLASASLRMTLRETQLTIDQDRNDWVVQGHGNYYTFDYTERLRTSAGHLTITVTPEFGDPDLFVNTGASLDDIYLPVRHSAEYSEFSPGDDAMSISMTAAKPFLKLLILGADSSNFTLLVSDDQSTVSLSNGRPKRFESAAGKYRYFSASVPGTQPLRITVTPLTGDPDLFVSTNAHRPDSTSSTWSSLDVGNRYEHVVIPSTDVNRCTNVAECAFYIGVLARSATTYSIAATWGSQSTWLIDGLPQAGQVTQQEVAAGNTVMHYMYKAPGSHADISFGLSIQYGAAHIFVLKNGPASPSHFEWSSSPISQSSDRLDILQTDAKFCPDCDYYVAVAPAPDATGTMAPVAYTLSASSAAGLTVLEDGAPATSVAVASGHYEYFKLFVSEKEPVNVEIILTPYRGDPDLYVSTVNSHPNTTDYQLSSQDADGDIVELNHEDPRLKDCQDRQTTCVVYIAVYAARGNAQFSLLGTVVPVSKGFHVDLPESIAGDYEFTVATFGPPLPERPLSQFVAYAQPHHACGEITNADELTGMIALVDRGPRTDECPLPERYFANKVLRVQEANAVAVIMANNDDTMPSQLVYMGAVSGDAASGVTIPSVFVSYETASILRGQLGSGVHVSLSQPIDRLPRLTPGNPQRGTALHSQFKYYEIWTPPGKDSIQITLTPSFGNPDLFISAGGLLPSQLFYTWTSETSGSETLLIDANDPHACRNCRYYVGVLGAASATAYTIQYQLLENCPTLQVGLPVPNVEVGLGDYRCFRVYVDGNGRAGLTVAVTVSSGDADLYLDFNTDRPTKDHHLLAAAGRTTCNNVDCGNTIRQGDAVHVEASQVQKHCHGGPCLAYIGLYGALNSTVSLLATLDDTDTNHPWALVDGVSQLAKIDNAGSYDYYTFSVGQDVVAFEVTVMPSKGDPDLYITRNDSFPSRYKWDWRSTGAAGEVVRIPTDDPTACVPCVYRIAVYAWTDDVRYSVAATSTTGTLLLNRGVAAPSKAAPGEYRFYRYFVRSHDRIELILTDFSGNPSLFAWFDVNPTANASRAPEDAIPPSPFSSERPAGPETLLLGDGRSDFCDLPCTLYAAVRAETNSTFSLLITQPPEVTVQLVDGQPQAMNIQTGSGVRHFAYEAANLSSGVVFTLAAFAGSPKLYVAWDGEMPSASKYAASGDASNPLVIAPCPPDCKGRNFLLTVAGGPAEFAITAKSGSAIQLLQDRTPIRAELQPGKDAEFKVDVPPNANSAVLAVTALQGRVSVLLAGGEYYPGQSITASKSEPATLDLFPGTTSRITVAAPPTQLRSSTFVLLPILYGGNSSDSSVVLFDGQPSAITVLPGRSQRFHFEAPAGQAVTLTAVPSDLSSDALLQLHAGYEMDGSLPWAKLGQPGDKVIMFVLPSTKGDCQAYCSLFVELSSFTPANVTLTASSVGSVDTLAIAEQQYASRGGTFPGSEQDAHLKQYVLLLSAEDASDDRVTLDLQVCGGRAPVLYASSKPSPSEDLHEYDSGSPPKPVTATFAGVSKAFVSVSGTGGTKYELQVRKAKAEPLSSALSSSEGKTEIFLRREATPMLELRFQLQAGFSEYELYFGDSSSETRQSFRYFCGVKEVQDVPFITAEEIKESITPKKTDLSSPTVQVEVPLTEDSDGNLCSSGRSEPCLNVRQKAMFVLVAKKKSVDGTVLHALYTPVDGFTQNSRGGMSGFGVFCLLVFLALVGYVIFWFGRRKMQGEHMGADKETLSAFTSETLQLLRAGAAMAAAFGAYCFAAASKGWEWTRRKVQNAQAQRQAVRGTRTVGRGTRGMGESMTAPLTASAAPYISPGELPALAPAVAVQDAVPNSGTEPLQLVMASPLPRDEGFSQPPAAAAPQNGEMFGEPVLVSSTQHAGMD